jgi:NAD(P)-dependent dehydrogenase (short-subunit alcohol dehydrogenase family)
MTGQAFVTGTSRGLGKACVEYLLQNGWEVVGIGRNVPEFDIKINHDGYEHISADLSNAEKTAELILPFKAEAPQHLLINNAACIGEIAPVGKLNNYQLIKDYNLNVIAPAILSNKFLMLTKSKFDKNRYIINISSGASKNPYGGWAMYSSSKAALDAFAKSVHMENEQLNDKRTFFCSVAPGVIDTNMQEHIRNSNPEYFPKKNKFIEMHQKHQLKKPSTTARKLLDVVLGMRDNNYWVVFDLRDLDPLASQIN